MARGRRKKKVKLRRLGSLQLALVLAAVAAGVAIVVHFTWPTADVRTTALSVPGCQRGPTVAGIDVSYYQQAIAWPRVRRAGIRFAFIRASDGLTLADPRFAKNWQGAKRAGLLRGAYQYFRPEQSALDQADLLIAAIDRDPGELPPVIDVESTGGASAAELATSIRTWVDRVRTRLGVEPIVYTGPDFWRTRVAGADLARQPLWIAHYTPTCPTVPAPWRRWTFWQHADTGRVPGIAGPVDLDVFAGSFGELQDFARRSRLPR